MSNCTECTKVEKICEEKKPCGCPIPDLSTDCVKYDGEPLSCSGIATPNTLTQIIKKLDEFICNKFENTFIGELLNIGGGAEIYKQTNNLTGRQEVRTLESDDDSITITQTDNTINFTLAEGAGEDKYVKSISLVGENGTELLLGFEDDTELSVDLASINTDNFLSQDPTFDSNTGELSFQMEGGEVRTVNISELQQTQSNILENDNTNPAFIKNKNHVDVVTTDYSIKADDNNKVILLDTTNSGGTPIDIVVDLKDTSLPAAQQPPNDNYFVGFLQKGTGEVSFINGTPPDNYESVLLGQGHNAAVEIINGEVFLFGALTETP